VRARLPPWVPGFSRSRHQGPGQRPTGHERISRPHFTLGRRLEELDTTETPTMAGTYRLAQRLDKGASDRPSAGFRFKLSSERPAQHFARLGVREARSELDLIRCP
jgi:hypothetical protein